MERQDLNRIFMEIVTYSFRIKSHRCYPRGKYQDHLELDWLAPKSRNHCPIAEQPCSIPGRKGQLLINICAAGCIEVMRIAAYHWVQHRSEIRQSRIAPQSYLLLRYKSYPNRAHSLLLVLQTHP